ncbi:Hint domain-containing protein [Cobetia sp. L2A1]|uniref:Hint domain-containing protein n=1 Tax=Cobetia sp. L2A1 TaxID=2686360 RepID=UPI00131C7FA9|nr:Hint domain-containing protein [Cobetia sp. L2A1]
MAVINLDLAGTQTQVIDSGNSGGDESNTVNISALGSSELIVDGISADIESILGIEAGASPTFTATNAGEINIDQGLLSLTVGSSTTYNIEDSSSINLDGGTIGALSGLSTSTVNFSGSEDGSFSYSSPSIGVLNTVNFEVNGMEAGDIFSTNGDDWTLADGANSYNAETGYLSITSDNTSVLGTVGTTVNANIAMTQEEADGYLSGDVSLNNGENGFEFVCFAEGTMIATPEGEVAVEALKIGDLVVTASGAAVPVKWVGRQTVRPATAKDKFQAVRIQANTFAQGTPNQDLTVTASHGMIIDGLVINAGALINGTTITAVSARELPKEVTYYHVETENHEVIIANGAEAETYIDYIDRQAFENYEEYTSLYSVETRIVEMSRPRISARRLVPMAIRERLAIREQTLDIQAA